jgi:cation diffusion facilitator CzcD-associated flavoprotein CzcO
MADETSPAGHQYEAIIIGAGMCGVYQLYRLRELGVDAILLEAGADVGGTWYWNRYPGARFDSESYTYAYSFSKELLDEWHWSERFAGQAEIHRYISHVVQRFGLRPYMRFEQTVTAARWREDRRTWTVETAAGDRYETRLLMTAVGVLSMPVIPAIEGLDTAYRGVAFHSSRWPDPPIDLTGKRVAVVGTGATGVQIISEIARDVAQLYVFQRHPSWGAPLNNGPITKEEMARIKAHYDEIWEQCMQTPGGFIHAPDRRRINEVTEEERLAFWEKLYGEPGFGILLGNFLDCATNEHANSLLSEFVADKIRERVHDPVVAEKLIPRDHGFGTRRLALETNYYEVYNRDNVELVDLIQTPIERISADGVVTTARQYPVDVIIFATGFDAVTGSFDRIKFIGVNGQTLRDRWADGPITYLGVQSHGFPNLLFLSGPQAGSGAANFPRGIEDGVKWATQLVAHLRANDFTRIEATVDAEQRWAEHVAEKLSKMLVGRTKSWFTGFNSNLAGRDKPRMLLYMGGNILYRQIIDDVAESGYEGFVLSHNDDQPPVDAPSVPAIAPH